MPRNLQLVAPEVITVAEAETYADRKAAVTLAVRLMEKTRPATGNAYLTRKGFPALECLTLTAMHKTGGVTFRASRCMTIPAHWLSGNAPEDQRDVCVECWHQPA
ncbi:Zinc binding domain / DNA primase [Klebsiella pneumoniae]|nr:Zinc binding domain / DNA primase [Klebsiella pneumoniae]